METVYKNGKLYKSTSNELAYFDKFQMEGLVLSDTNDIISLYPFEGLDPFFSFKSIKLAPDRETVVSTKIYKHTENLDSIFNTSGGVSLSGLNIPQGLTYIGTGYLNGNADIAEVYFTYNDISELTPIAQSLGVDVLPAGVDAPTEENKIPMFQNLIDESNEAHTPFKNMLIGSLVMDGTDISALKVYYFY